MITVLFFGALKAKAGAAQVTLALPSPADVVTLKATLNGRYPWLSTHWHAVRVAVNLEFAEDSTVLADGAEVALIPPVAGGAPHPRVRLMEEPLSLDEAVQQVRAPQHGGLCVFAGMVRNHAAGHAVIRLDYSAYGPMAVAQMEKIVSAAEKEHGATVACHHRVGSLQVGDTAVVIAAAAPHRDACFAATRQVIEALKKDVPIWKQEWSPDGATWVGMGP